MTSREQSHWTAWLDGIEAVASTLYLVLTIVIAGVALAVLLHVARHAPFGSQGEWLYLAGGALLVIGWAMGQTAWLLRRRWRARARDVDTAGPRIDLGPSGLSFEWNPAAKIAEPQKGVLSWNFQLNPSLTTFRIDRAQLALARALHVSALSWDEICRPVNVEYDRLSPMEQMLYQRALRMSVEDSSNPEGDAQ